MRSLGEKKKNVLINFYVGIFQKNYCFQHQETKTETKTKTKTKTKTSTWRPQMFFSNKTSEKKIEFKVKRAIKKRVKVFLILIKHKAGLKFDFYK